MNFEALPTADTNKDAEPKTLAEAREAAVLSPGMSEDEIAVVVSTLDTAWNKDQQDHDTNRENKMQAGILKENESVVAEMTEHGEMPGKAQDSILHIMEEAGAPEEMLALVREKQDIRGTIDSIHEWFGDTRVGKAVTAMVFSCALFSGSMRAAEAGNLFANTAAKTAQQAGQRETGKKDVRLNSEGVRGYNERVNQLRNQWEEGKMEIDSKYVEAMARDTSGSEKFMMRVGGEQRAKVFSLAGKILLELKRADQDYPGKPSAASDDLKVEVGSIIERERVLLGLDTSPESEVRFLRNKWKQESPKWKEMTGEEILYNLEQVKQTAEGDKLKAEIEEFLSHHKINFR